MDQVEEVKQKTDIVQIISEHVQLKRAGRNFKGNCPFHSEKTPSFMVSPELQIYKCFGCNAGGDVFRFLMDFESIDFPQALKLLAERAGVKLQPLKGFSGHQEKEEIYRLNFLVSEFFHYILTSHKLGLKALNYLKNRGISEESIKTFKLGYSPESQDATFHFLTIKKGYKPELVEKAGLVSRSQNGYFDRFRGRVIFPLNDHFGNVLGFAGRVIENKGDMAKYINSPETLAYKKGNTLYGLSVIKQEIKKKGYVVLVEGEFDCISSWQAGVQNVVAIKGSALTEDQAKLISRFCSRVVLGLDSDFAGDQAARRGLDIIRKAGLETRVIDLKEYKDPDQMAQKNPEGWASATEGARGIYDFLIDSVFSRFDAQSTEGKSLISQNIVPILASIEDEIVKAHCIKKVAERLGVLEEAVRKQVDKKAVPFQRENKQESTAKPIPRREVIEKHLLSLIFHLNAKLVLEEEIKTLITTPVYRRLIDEVERWNRKNVIKVWDAQGFAGSLPPELIDVYSTVVLSEIEMENPEEIKKELEQAQKELKVMDVRQTMLVITEKIKDSEEEGKQEEIEALETQLSEATSSLSKLSE